MSQLPAIRYARDAGHRVVAVDGDANAVAFPFCDVAENVDFTDVDRVTEVAASLGVQGVLAISTDRAVAPAAAIASRLRLPGIGVEVAEVMTDKASMRKRLEAAGITQPRYAVLRAGLDVAGACSTVAFPAVLKPVDSGGQRGVFRVESTAQVERLLAAALAFSRSGRAMLEEFIDGIELNGIFVARAGDPKLVTLSDRLRPTGLGFGVGWIHSFPSALPRAVLAQAEQAAGDAVRALGLRDGIAFPQLIAAPDGTVRVIEIAARIPAGQMADLVLFGTGINLFEVAIEQALGRPVPDQLLTPSSNRPIAIRFLTALPGVLPVGTVVSIQGLDAVRASPGVLAADLYFEPGTTITPLRVDADRRGYVIATADTAPQALALADHASERLDVRTEEPARIPARGRRRARRTQLVLAGLVLALALGIGGALVDNKHASVHGVLVLGTRMNDTFSPVCRCATDVAHVTFRLVHAERLSVQIVNSVGHPVSTFVRDRTLHAGWKQFVWTGLSRSGHALANGLYATRVSFPALHRTVQLPGRITLDTRPPRLLQLSVRSAGSWLFVHFVFDGPARAALLVDGRQVVRTRRVATRGHLIWDGRLADGRRPGPGPYRLSVVGIDAAGNRSAATPARVGEKLTDPSTSS